MCPPDAGNVSFSHFFSKSTVINHFVLFLLSRETYGKEIQKNHGIFWLKISIVHSIDSYSAWSKD